MGEAPLQALGVLSPLALLTRPCWPQLVLPQMSFCCSVAKLCLSLCDPMDCSPPGSSSHGISQARTSEWFAISSAGDLPEAEIKPESPKWGEGFFTTAPPGKPMLLMTTCSNPCKLQLLLLSRFRRIRLCATPKTAAHQAPPSLGFSRQEHWSGLPLPSPIQVSFAHFKQIVVFFFFLIEMLGFLCILDMKSLLKI